MRKRAFTLIELLVVIAIISILAAMLFPVFAQAKATAKQSVCIVHMRQMGIAMMMYRTDYDDMWPAAVNNVPYQAGFSPQQFWIGYDNNNSPLAGGFTGAVNKAAINRPRPGMIDPYIKNEGIKSCPSQPDGWQMAMAYNWFNPQKDSAYYNTNPAARGNEFGPGAFEMWIDNSGLINSRAINDSQMEDPVGTLVLWEHNARVPLCNFLQSVDWEESPPIHLQYLADHFNFLHREGSVTLWGDSHTKRVIFTQLKRRMFSVRKDIYD